MKIKLPNLFIVGAAKAGTTSLYEYFKQHPQIFMVESDLQKEPSYFCSLVKPSKKYKYYLSLFEKATENHVRIGEASTSYLTCPESALRIKEYENKNNLDCRIIIMLRNPVDRAYSLYNWMTQSGYEWCGSFEKALRIEKKDNQIRLLFSDGAYVNSAFKELFSGGLSFEPAYIGIFALKGFTEEAGIIPVRISYFSLSHDNCSP